MAGQLARDSAISVTFGGVIRTAKAAAGDDVSPAVYCPRVALSHAITDATVTAEHARATYFDTRWAIGHLLRAPSVQSECLRPRAYDLAMADRNARPVYSTATGRICP